jgi:hypothetical protein
MLAVHNTTWAFRGKAKCFIEMSNSQNIGSQAGSQKLGRRARRMPTDSAILMCRGDESWTTELQDISATGLLALRPSDWIGQRGDHFVLDLLLGESLNIHLEARVMRIEEDELGFAFSRIPPEKEAALWSLLGGYADSLELWRDEDSR